MSPAVIDLTSSPEPDESPSKAANIALERFQPRAEKSKLLSGFVEASTQAARASLDAFLPRKQKERVSLNGTVRTGSQSGRQRPDVAEDDHDTSPLGAVDAYDQPISPQLPVTNHTQISFDQRSYPGEYYFGKPYSGLYQQKVISRARQNDNQLEDQLERFNDYNAQQAKRFKERHEPSGRKASKPTEVIDLRDEDSDSDSFHSSEEFTIPVLHGDVSTRPLKKRRLGEYPYQHRPSSFTTLVENRSLATGPYSLPQQPAPDGDSWIPSNPTSHAANVHKKPPQSPSTNYQPSNGWKRSLSLHRPIYPLTEKDSHVKKPSRAGIKALRHTPGHANFDTVLTGANGQKVAYSASEDALILKLRDVDKLIFRKMAPYFNGRTVKALENRYYMLSKVDDEQHPQPKQPNPKRNQSGNSEQGPLYYNRGSQLPERGNPFTTHGEPYTPQEDALLWKLKEVKNLSWDEICKHFSGRTRGSLQTRYCNKVKGTYQHQAPLMSSQQSGNVFAHRSPFPALDASVPMSREVDLAPRSGSSQDVAVAQRGGRRRNNEVSALAGSISWADIDEHDLEVEIDAEVRKPSKAHAQCLGERAFPKSLSGILRHRELGGDSARSWTGSTRSVPDELKEHVFDDIGPRKYFQGTSGDVTCLAWAPDGRRFAAGSIAITDERSMQYNRPCNLLLGDYDCSLLRELPEHNITRPEVNSEACNVNSLHSMRETQDPRLFMTVASVQFSPDSQTLYSAGSDCKVRAYSVNQDINTSWQYEIEHPAPVYLLSASNQNVLASASHQAADGSIGVYHDQAKVLSLSPSRQDSQTQRAIYPSALKWGSAWNHSNLLLAGFSIDSVDDERYLAGETCLWDIASEKRIEMSAVTRNVFDLTWNPSPSSTSTVFAVAGTPGLNKVNRGVRSVLQLFAPSQNRAVRVMDLECPAFDINDVIYSPYDDNLIAAGAKDGKVYVWDQRFANRGQSPLHILKHEDSLNVLDHDRDREVADTGVRFLSWGGTSSRLYSGSSDGVVKVWNPYRSSDNAHIKDVATFTSAVMSGAFSPDYRDLLIGEDQGRINLLSVGYENRNARSMQRFELQSAPVPRDGTRTLGLDGHAAARELLRSGQIELRPMGALPIRQAVQGPRYEGPHLAPTADEVNNAEQEYQYALDEQNEAHSRMAVQSQDSQTDKDLRIADKRVEAAQQGLIGLQDRLDDSATLTPKAEAMQRAFRRAEKDRMKLEASLSRSLELCKLDCNYLPPNLDEGAEVPDICRWEARIPSMLWKRSEPDVWLMTTDDLAEAGLTSKCVTCFGPAPKPESGLPLCESCRHTKHGLTSTCVLCSTPIRLPIGQDALNMCERCNFACFRCGRSSTISRNALKVTCDSCGLTWRAGVLGYKLVSSSMTSGKKRAGVSHVELLDGDLEGHEQLGDAEMEHYASRWQTKQ